MKAAITRAIALDLGSTRIKAGRLLENGQMILSQRVDAPGLYGKGLIREGDAESYIKAAVLCLSAVLVDLPNHTPVGLAVQRSTFLLWERTTGKPVTPMISWQDRRAAEWCLRNKNKIVSLIKSTGLRLSPHYVAPKLADLFEKKPDLYGAAKAGKLSFGTLDSFLIWRLTRGRAHITDISMAARTLLADPVTGKWSQPLLTGFHIPPEILPKIVPSFGKHISLDVGGILTAIIADQSGALLGASGISGNSVLVNLGTGGFVIRSTGHEMKYHENYLSGPICAGQNQKTEYFLEGTINGISTALSKAPAHSPQLINEDPAPDAFCIPDTTGIGAPFWKSEMSFVLSQAAENLSGSDLRRVIMEGIIFRITDIIKDLFPNKGPAQILIAGGLSSEPFLCKGIAACSQYPVYRITDKEITLMGAAQLACKQKPHDPDKDQVTGINEEGEYLKEKYKRWIKWVKAQTGQ